MRYAGQSYEIEVALEPDWLSDLDRLTDAFHETHRRIYDFHDAEGRIEMVNLRLSAVGAGPKPDLAELARVEAGDSREVQVHIGGWRPVPLYPRAALAAGTVFEGPAIVAQEDTTFAIPVGASARVDGHLNIHLQFED